MTKEFARHKVQDNSRDICFSNKPNLRFSTAGAAFLEPRNDQRASGRLQLLCPVCTTLRRSIYPADAVRAIGDDRTMQSTTRNLNPSRFS
jgi:hypothetical protein